MEGQQILVSAIPALCYTALHSKQTIIAKAETDLSNALFVVSDVVLALTSHNFLLIPTAHFKLSAQMYGFCQLREIASLAELSSME